MLTRSANKILDLVGAPGRHSPPHFVMILNKKYTRLKDQIILKMIVIPPPHNKKKTFRERESIECDVSFQM